MNDEDQKDRFNEILLAYAIRDDTQLKKMGLEPLSLAEARRRCLAVAQSRDQQIALAARIDEHSKWKTVSEEIVSKDGVYRAVNYLNRRAIELDTLKQAQENQDV